MGKFFKLTKGDMWKLFERRKPKSGMATLTATHIYIRTAEAVGILNKTGLLWYAPGMKRKGVFQISGKGLNLLKKQNLDLHKEIKNILRLKK